jgi:5-methylcytosine-specific restriction protein A
LNDFKKELYYISFLATFHASCKKAHPESPSAFSPTRIQLFVGFFYWGSMDERKTSAQRGYGSRWQKARATFLRRSPLCVDHQKRGRIVVATVVDHIIPHQGDQSLFWDSSNWQSLCKQCHDSNKQRIEKSGLVVGCDLTGLPLDPKHHWAAKG